MSNVWIVIPAKNEAKRISKVIDATKRIYDNVVVVDDGSGDDTAKTAEQSDVVVLNHIVNLGKGAALKTGCDYAIQNGAEFIVTIDADGQHNPLDIEKLIMRLKGNDIVFGYRKLNKDMPFVFRAGNAAINNLALILYGLRLHDTQCGFRAFTSDAYKKIRWRATDYSMESEMIANTGKHRLKYAEVPIETVYGDKYKGTTILDGIKIAFNMITWKFKR